MRDEDLSEEEMEYGILDCMRTIVATRNLKDEHDFSAILFQTSSHFNKYSPREGAYIAGHAPNWWGFMLLSLRSKNKHIMISSHHSNSSDVRSSSISWC
ncbi:hypothetical protein V6N13_030124 [Hibiscus sabdariffa]